MTQWVEMLVGKFYARYLTFTELKLLKKVFL